MTRISASVKPYVLSEKDRHVASRFSFGVNEQLVTAVKSAGGVEKWYAKQLSATSVKDTDGDKVLSFFPILSHSPGHAWSQVKAEKASGWDYGAAFMRYSMTYRITTTRQVREVMHDFWSNLLYIPAGEDRSFPWRFSYDKALRAKALTSYREILRTAIVHPAMSGWLTNYDNTKDGINENLGRELLELFTVGRGAGYTETDVKNAARLLTGFRVRVFQDYAASYDPKHHWTGQVDVLGFSHKNTSADGRAAVNALIDYLALHPSTAERIARRLCVRFVSDEPSATLVKHVAKAYTASRSDVKATMKALRAHPEFLATRRQKLSTPVEDVVAALRALGVRPAKPTGDESLANCLYWMTGVVGQYHYLWPRPDGFPETSSAWSSPARMLGSWRMRYALAGNWLAKGQQVRPKDKDVLPTSFPRTLGEIVEHQSRLLLGTSADAATVKAVETMLFRTSKHVYKKASELDAWQLTVIRGTVLNHPLGVLR